ncbi:hypothetical protein [Virgibacillus oceani]|uniref:Uncharacterized protein n=1 Tax=Virgibacillus oceani TaxID=1479511 RepID=A0A917HHM5_9BACI|nr:hypothetical protein [Virgibacillus oceani]GGG79146.1 hypothetical protein GCM10011398_25580 [Virgibacillus oceani]
MKAGGAPFTARIHHKYFLTKGNAIYADMLIEVLRTDKDASMQNGN